MFVSGQCPMLIGIMRRSNNESSWIFPFDYEYQVLVERENICRTDENLTQETLLRELIVFKEKYVDNEKNLVSQFLKICFQLD